VLHGWGGEELLASYEQERMAAALENIDVTSATMDFLVPQDDAALRHRLGVLDRAVTDPEVRTQVDSGRLAEPFWYVGSPLTTPNANRPFPGRPLRGRTPPVVPGVVVPDVPIRSADVPGAARFRQIARDGFLVLAGDDVETDAIAAVLQEATTAPTCVLALADIDTTGALREALRAEPGQVWVIRPDAHLAAIVPAADTAALTEAVQRAAGSTVPTSTA
jgi:pentachlorophenol monooxygenase/3-(3-hydroxy-phenyl)propionate hydroxylase